MVKARAKREKRTVDASRYVTEHVSGGSRAFQAPEGVSMFKPPKTGGFEIDILPFEVGEAAEKFKHSFASPGDLHFERTYFAHYGIGPDQDAVVCLARTFDKPCPVCEHRQELALDPKTPDKVISALAAKERQLFLVYDHNEPAKGVKLWEIAHWNFGRQLLAKIANASPKRKAAYQKFADPEEGSTLRITGIEESMGGVGKPYSKYSVDEFEERSKALDDKLLDHGICLDDIVTPLSYEQLKRLFLQLDEDEEEAPKRSKPSRNGRAAVKEEEEEEEEEDETEEEEPDEEESEETEEDEGAEIEIGMEVEFEYKGKIKTGVISAINEKKRLVQVEVEGQEKDSSVSFDDLTILEEGEETEEEEEPEEEVEEEEEAEEEGGWEDDEPAPKKKPGKKPAVKKPAGKKPRR